MANRFWVGGSGLISQTAHWSTTSGGAGGSAVPTSSDAVIIDNNSGNPTITIDNDTNIWGSLTAGDSTKVTTQLTKTVSFAWSSVNAKSVVGDITFYGNVGFVGTVNTNGFIMTGVTVTYKCYTDSTVPYLELQGSGSTFTISDGVADSGSPIYNIGRFNMWAIGTISKVIFPKQTNGAFLTINDWHPTTIGSFHPIQYDFNLGSLVVITGKLDWSTSTQPQTALNVGGSTVRLQSAQRFVNQGSLMGIVEIVGSTTVDSSFSMSQLKIDNGATLYSSATLTCANFLIGNNITLVGRSSSSPMIIVVPGGAYTTYNATISNTHISGTDMVAVHSSDGGNNSGIIFIRGGSMHEKFYRYDVYASSGLHADPQQYPATYIGQMTNVITDPLFSQEINSAGGQMVIRIGCDPTNFGEQINTNGAAQLINYRNKVVITCFNDDAPNGETLYVGFISSWTPNVGPSEQYVDVTILPYGAELSQNLAASSNALTLNDIEVNLFNGITGFLTFTGTAVAQSFVTPGHTVNTVAIRPRGWSWYNTYMVNISIQADLGDAPSGIWLWGTSVTVKGITQPSEFFDWVPASVTLAASTKYWFVIEAIADTFGPNNPRSMSSTRIIAAGAAADANHHAAYKNALTEMLGTDTFTDAANTLLTTHVGDGGVTWSQNSGGGTNIPRITNANRLRGNAHSPESEYYMSTIPTSADYTVKANFYAASNTSDDAGIWARLSTTAITGYFAQLSYSSGNGVSLFKCVAGVYTQLGSTHAYTLTPGSTATVALNVSGTTISVLLNGAVVISVTDSSVTATGRAGVRMLGADTDTTGFHLDDIAIIDSWTKNSSWGVMELVIFSSWGNTTITYSSTNVASAISDIMAAYSTQGGTVQMTLGTTVEDPGVNVSYTLQSNTVSEAIQILVNFCPAGWYWYIDPATSYLHVHPAPQAFSANEHVFRLGEGGNVKSIALQKTMETIINNIYLTGGDTGGGVNLWRRYVNTSSQLLYGTRAITYNDSNLIDATSADFVGRKLIGQFKDPTYRAPVIVSSAPGLGYHIEILRPGDMFYIVNINRTISHIIISRIDYAPYQATIDASTVPPQINTTVTDIQLGLSQVQTVGNPVAPTIIEVD